MDQINNSRPAGGMPLQYGKWTFQDISHTLQESAPLSDGDRDKITRYDPTPQERRAVWNRWFADEAMSNVPLISDAYKEISARADEAINSFLDGSLSEQELSETVQGLLGDLAAACEERGYPLPLAGDDMMVQSRADCFYSEMRRKLLAAVDRNNQEGRQYVTGGADFRGDWKYYNSDYYFKSEAGIAALTDGLLQYAEQEGFENFSIRDYGAEKKNLYNNFNTAWSNNFDLSQQYMEDYNQVPPRDFVWFYQTGGGGEIDTEAQLVSITHPDGRVEFVGEEEEDTGFDPHSFDSATTWAAYRDAQGNLHRVSADFSYNRTESDLRRVSSLLRFSARDEKVSAFLQNLRVYSRGYFRDYPAKRLDFRA